MSNTPPSIRPEYTEMTPDIDKKRCRCGACVPNKLRGLGASKEEIGSLDLAISQLEREHPYGDCDLMHAAVTFVMAGVPLVTPAITMVHRAITYSHGRTSLRQTVIDLATYYSWGWIKL